MKLKATIQSSRVFFELMNLPADDRSWVLQQYWQSLDREDRKELQSLFAESGLAESGNTSPLFESAKERLLEDPDLTAGEKVLLAALVLRELYEVEEFHSRQITETLKEASNPVKNITAALNGLMSKGEAVVADPNRTGHKRYRLTSAGISAAILIAGKSRDGRAAMEPLTPRSPG